ncbi:MAG: cytochrome c oxidase cbb3-type subunit 3 [Saprospiraceae bacterium]|jgi:cytochrome c oxidase cbb3-type subunit 3
MKNKHIFRSIPIITMSLMPEIVIAAGKVQSNPYMTWVMKNIIFVLGAIIIIGAAITLWNLAMTLIEHNSKEALRAQGIEPKPKVNINAPSWLAKMYDKAWNLAPMDKEADIILDHDYDGIRELDNSLPPWWLYGFYLSIVIGIGYVYVYHFSDLGYSQQEEYEIAIQKGEDQKDAFAARQTNSIDEKNLVVITDADALAVGQKIYIASCAACHGPDGQGTVGPNLTDDYWIHGGHVKDVYATIKNGVPEKGMIAWKSQLQPTTIVKVASYIKSLKGTNPPNPKAIQGVLYEEPQVVISEEK